MSQYSEHEHEMFEKVYYIQDLLNRGVSSTGKKLSTRLRKAYTDFVIKYLYIGDCIRKENYQIQQTNRIKNFHKSSSEIWHEHDNDANNNLGDWHSGGYNE